MTKTTNLEEVREPLDLAAIDLPAESAPPRTRRGTPDVESADEVQQTLAEYERAAILTGDWNGTDPVEFSHDGETWTTAWGPAWDNLPVDEDDLSTTAHPTFARATVYRKGVKRPTVVVVRWDEALPADDYWRGVWHRKPVTLFGAFTLRAAYRRAFHDAIADRTHDDPEVTP